MMNKIIVLQPTRGLLFTKAQQALEEEFMINNIPMLVLRTDNKPIPDCRNILATEALKHPYNAEAFLWLDDDVIIPEGGLNAMMEGLKKADISFIDYPMHYTGQKWGNMGTATYDDWLPGQDWKDKPIAWAGLGCTLVKREVFEKLQTPYFVKTQKTFERDDNGHITIHDDEHKFGGGGEDVYFFLKAKEAGFTIKSIDMTAGHARIIRVVRSLDEGKYHNQHSIAINSEVRTPYR